MTENLENFYKILRTKQTPRVQASKVVGWWSVAGVNMRPDHNPAPMIFPALQLVPVRAPIVPCRFRPRNTEATARYRLLGLFGWLVVSLLVYEEVLLTDLCKRKILFRLKIYDRLRQATAKRTGWYHSIISDLRISCRNLSISKIII